MTLPLTTVATVDEQGNNPPRHSRTHNQDPDPLLAEEDASPLPLCGSFYPDPWSYLIAAMRNRLLTVPREPASLAHGLASAPTVPKATQ